MESCPTQAVLPLVGLAADKLIRDRYSALSKLVFRVGYEFGGATLAGPMNATRGDRACRSHRPRAPVGKYRR
ncbi:MAG: hypothetical protein R6U98_16800, partial [Pirellulaceae bacterium]